MHRHARDPRQRRAANGVRAQQSWAVLWVSAPEYKNEARKPHEQGRDGNGAAEDQSDRECDATLNGRVAHGVHDGFPLASAFRWINQRVVRATCKRQRCYKNQRATASSVHFTRMVTISYNLASREDE